MLLGQFTGLVWEACDSLAQDTDKLEEADAFDKLIFIRDSQMKHDKPAKSPHAFEGYFYKTNRKSKETLFAYSTRIRLFTKRILGQ